MYRRIIWGLLSIFVYILMCRVTPAEGNVFEMGRGGAVHPAFYMPDIRSAGMDGACSGFLSSYSNPYSIPGLSRTDIKGGVAAGRYIVSVSWSDISHQLYEENTYQAGFITGPWMCGYAGIAGSLVIRGVKGCEKEKVRDFRAVAGLKLGGGLSLGYEKDLYGTGESGIRRSSLKASLRVSGVSILINRNQYWRDRSETIIGIETVVTGSVCILAGYRFRTGEISFGAVYRWKGNILIFSWSDHPVLGTTTGCGAGRWWTE